ncbi:carboxypeptidase-like regulatory domain-containing protein [Hyalangium rubrum]|uniref:Carboxypeptidase-like regulatory domain-containing protein n=1 Tax=Hyalangium rubrum TaxID=3103134 RepID=A0ABU5H146_9BACT|nr:carboxypeptidase-like regulatory domain-containing protein [Hyalangium sp. s54d21]MDY7226854.1 carboxypeptidase-like regulatory domain-containing protein [Hyalangium sp. s54d21]
MHKQAVQSFLRNLPALLVALCLGLGSSAAAQTEYQRFAGQLASKSGTALTGTITINGVRKATATDGSFEIYVPTATRYVIDATRNGYVPTSLIHTGDPLESLDVRLTPAEVYSINPTQNIDVTDSRGTRITIPAGSLVDAQGRPAPAALQLQVYTYDLRNEEMVGDMSGLDVNGSPVMLQSIGAVSAEFRDANGILYNLASGRTARLSLRADPANTFSGTVPLWWYDQAQGMWIEEGSGTVTNGVATGDVKHFTVWNFDTKSPTPACIKLTIDPAYLYSSAISGVLTIRMKVPAPWFRDVTRTVNTPGPHALYNLPPNVNVEFIVNGAPYAIVNTGAAFGGTGIPAYPYNVCKGLLLNVNGTPQTGTIQGKVLRQHRTNHGGVAVTVRSGSTVLGSTVTDAAGNFSLQAAAGTRSATASRPGYLAAQRASLSLAAGGTVTLPTVTLLAGDMDGDNDIDWTDVSAIGPYVTNPPAGVSPSDARDVNGNLFIDWDDVSKAAANGGRVGASPW